MMTSIRDYYTVIDSDLHKKEIETPSGMAHWAGTGPEGAKCGDCIEYRYDIVDNKGRNTKRNSCFLYYRKMGKHGSILPPQQSACKYFNDGSQE